MSSLPRPSLLLPLVLLAPASGAQITKLSAPLARDMRAGRVSEHFLTSDGARVVYRADTTELQWEVFSRPVDGSAPSITLNPPLHPQGDVGVNGNLQGSIALGAGDRVVYIADAVTEDLYQLYSAPADGSAPAVLLSQPGVAVVYLIFTSGPRYGLSPDGTHVLFRTGGFLDGTGALHIVPVDGSTPPVTLVQGTNVDGFWASPDGSQVAFGAWAPGLLQQDLFDVPSDASQAPRFLARTHAPSFLGQVSVEDLRFTPDGTRVVFTELDDFDGDLSYELHSVPVDASQAKVRLDPGGHAGEFTLVSLPGAVRALLSAIGGYASVLTDGSGYVVLSPPGTTPRVGPVVDGTEVFFGAFDTSTAIYRAPIDGSQGASFVCAVSGSLGQMVAASPTELAFVASDSSFVRRAYSVPRTGGTPLPLASAYGITLLVPLPDGVRLLMQASFAPSVPTSLYVVPLDASQPPLELLTPEDGLNVFDTQLTPDGSLAISRTRPPAQLDADLYRVMVDGSSPPLQLNEVVTGGTVGDVTHLQLTPDGTTLVYRADLDSDEDHDLVALDASLVERRLGDGAGSALPDFAFTPDSARAVFQTVENGSYALQVAELSGGSSIVLDQGNQPAVAPFLFDSSAGSVVYRRQISGARLELRSAPLDGLSGPFPVHAALGLGRSVSDFRVANGTVVFLADLAQDDEQELWAAPLDGAAPPVRLSPTLVVGGDVTAFELDPAGTMAVFLADAHLNNRFELYRVPVDDSAPVRRISASLPTGGDVMEFAVTPDGARVVYRADQISDGRFDLFSTPLMSVPPHASLDGVRRPRVTLLSALGPGRAVQTDWQLSPDGQEVVYRASPFSAGVFELLRVPIDGSTPPVALSGVIPSTGDVESFLIAPDQSRIAFVADLRANNVMEPYSVPFAGGPVLPLDVFSSLGDVSAYRIDPSSRDLVFSADRDLDGAIELYRVPLDGSLPARRLNPPFASNRDVQPDFVPLPLGTLYRADQQQDEVIELYIAF